MIFATLTLQLMTRLGGVLSNATQVDRGIENIGNGFVNLCNCIGIPVNCSGQLVEIVGTRTDQSSKEFNGCVSRDIMIALATSPANGGKTGPMARMTGES